MKFIIWTVLFTSLLTNVYCSDPVMCTPDLQCPTKDTFLHSYSCCRNSAGEYECCKKLRWRNVAIIICCVIGILIILWLISCLLGFCKCIYNCLCCCFKRK
ncbi:unnamed protein product [Heterobilharzia americana]|nr:unnamed protein product [Heterobilharzia americana]